MVTLIEGDWLLERAHQAHLRAHSLEATPCDQFLLFVDEAAEMGAGTNGIRQLTREQLAQIQEILKEDLKLRREKDEGWNECNIRHIRFNRQKKCVQSFNKSFRLYS